MSSLKVRLCSVILMLVGAAVVLQANTALAINPRGAPGKHRGIGIWVTKNGEWHLNSHTDKQPHVFTGTIRVVGAKISGARGIEKLDKGDFWKINGAKGTVDFRLSTDKKWDRIDLLLAGRANELIFNLREDGKPMKPRRIFVGREGKHPESCRFTLSGK